MEGLRFYVRRAGAATAAVFLLAVTGALHRGAPVAVGSASARADDTTRTIYSSLPRRGAAAPTVRAIERGARMALAERDGKVGKYRIAYKRLDDSAASTGVADERRGRATARRAARDEATIGYIGQYNSGISKVTIPILNRAGIAQVSPSNTYVGLTTKAPGHARGEPGKYYPTERRTYARVLPNDVVQRRALARAVKEDGCAGIHILRSGTLYSNGMARGVRRAAAKLGVEVRRTDRYDPRARSYEGLAKRVKAPCAVQTGEIESNGARVLRAIARAHDKTRLYGSDGTCTNHSRDPDRGIPHPAAKRFRCTLAALPPRTFGPRGRQFFARYAERYDEPNPDPYAIIGYESMSLLLDSIRRATAGGAKLTRRRVVNALFATKARNSVMGTYSISDRGDTTLSDYGLYRIRERRLRFLRVIRTVP